MHEELLAVAVDAARAGGEILRRLYGAADLGAEEKAKNDLVSRADRESEAAIVARILGAFPDHSILAEEGGSRPGAGAGFEWIIDPLDGTANFLRGVPIFCVSIACVEHGRPVAAVVLDPLRDDLFTATRGGGARRGGAPLPCCATAPGSTARFSPPAFRSGRTARSTPTSTLFRDIFLEARGVRRCGAAALDLAYTAAGVFDGFFEFRLAPWDVAAGIAPDRGGGRRHHRPRRRRPLHRGGNILAGVPGVHRRLREIAARHASEAQLDRLVPAKVG